MIWKSVNLTFDLNLTYIRRSCGVHEVILKSYVRPIRVIFPLDPRNIIKLLNDEHLVYLN